MLDGHLPGKAFKGYLSGTGPVNTACPRWLWCCQTYLHNLPKSMECLNVAAVLLISKLPVQLFIVSCQSAAGCADVNLDAGACGWQ